MALSPPSRTKGYVPKAYKQRLEATIDGPIIMLAQIWWSAAVLSYLHLVEAVLVRFTCISIGGHEASN
jgi:hypothetical protein